MNKKVLPLGLLAVVLGLLYWVFGLPNVGNPEISTDPAAIARGEYLFNAGGCAACHESEGAEGPTGGYEIESPFGGTFHTPNITPDEETGIAGWTGRDFLLALKHGRSPNGGFYWPAFPFRTYKDMSDEDALDIAAYVMSLEPIRHEVAPHDLPAWQFSWMMAGWNIMAGVLEGDYPAISDDPQEQRGAYLARALGHCSECHTPRNALGMLQRGQEFAGAEGLAPAITPKDLNLYQHADFAYFLEEGMTANFEYVGGEMEEVIEHTKHLTNEDREAYATFFLRSVE